MKTLTLTITSLFAFILANTSPVVDMYNPEKEPVEKATDIGVPSAQTAPPEVSLPSEQSVARRELLRRLHQLRSGTYSSRGSSANISSETERVHVIPTEEITEEDLQKIMEDMNIMCHLLHKELQPRYDSVSRDRSRYGYSYSTWDLATVLGVESQNTEGIFLEGYGALFLIKVNFLLSAPPETKSEQREPKEAIDSAWEQAKQDLYESGDPTKKVEPISPNQYDTYKVDYLKDRLISALKYAANIRKLKPDDTVVVTVKGKPTAEDVANVLTLRTTKSDIDAYSQGDLNSESFRQKVKVLVY